jgi:hypothetical protein
MSLKLKILIKNVLLYRKRTRKVHLNFKHIRFGRLKSPVKGLMPHYLRDQSVIHDFQLSINAKMSFWLRFL